jgi:hypothetical protein
MISVVSKGARANRHNTCLVYHTRIWLRISQNFTHAPAIRGDCCTRVSNRRTKNALITREKCGKRDAEVSANGLAAFGNEQRWLARAFGSFNPPGLRDLKNYLPKVFSVGQQSICLGGTLHWEYVPDHWMQVAL